jgi:hypothetical protein
LSKNVVVIGGWEIDGQDGWKILGRKDAFGRLSRRYWLGRKRMGMREDFCAFLDRVWGIEISSI